MLKWCQNCINNSLSREFHLTKGWCNACQWMEEKKVLTGVAKKRIKKIISKFKSNSNYDCIVPVSGKGWILCSI